MTIAEVSRKYELSADTLRYYERIGLIPAVGRTDGGIRNYTEGDCRWIELAKCMRSAGVQIDALVRYVALFQQGDGTFEERKQILIDQREKLKEHIADMNSALERLNHKISRYDAVEPVENDLHNICDKC